MKKTLFLTFIVLSYFAQSQVKVGAWRDHFSYNDCIALTKGNGKIYGASSVGVFWYKISDGDIGKISRVNGLSDIDITSIEYSEENRVLAVGYLNGNIDLVFSNRILPMPQIKEKIMQGSKRINGFTFNGGLIFVSTDFGIVVIDIAKEEVKDTYFIGDLGESTRVNRTIVVGNDIYAATERGLLKADINDPLLIQYQHWEKQLGFSDPLSECSDVAVLGSNIIAVESNHDTQKDIVWSINSGIWNEVNQSYNTVSHIRATQEGLIVASREGLSVYPSLGALPTNYTTYNFTWQFWPYMAMPIDSKTFVIADRYLGLVIRKDDSFSSICPNGPLYNKAFSIGVSNDKVIITAGSHDAAGTSMWYNFAFYTLENQRWSSYEDGNNNDATGITFNPNNSNEYYIASWGKGIFQFIGNTLVNHFDPTNSSLQTIYANQPYCRVSGVTLDNGGNLWAANILVPNPISVRSVSGDWYSFPYAGVINSEKLSSFVCSPSGDLWLTLPGGGGFFVLNPGEKIDLSADDKYRKFTLTDRNGNTLPSNIYSSAFDNDGYLWVGTSEGVLISYNPEDVMDATKFEMQRVKIPDVVPGLAAYLLQTETVTAIAVDGGNRKWFGTSKSGVFLQSADGSKEIKRFNTQNSPLPSNNIFDIKVHPKTGEVFIATEKGVVGYRGDATLGGEKFGKVYAFPNPVKPNYDGLISIVGLVADATVKITDIAGNLVYETRSQGGTATWDGKNLNGNRVATGVYLIFCSDSKGEETAVSKLLFIK